MADGLTGKQQAFVDAYLSNGFNATDAARRAGYADPNRNAARLTVVNGIREAIQRGLTERAMPANEVLARIAEQARSTMDDFLDEEGKIDIGRARERGKLHLVKVRASTKEGERIELYSAQSALELLAKHHGLLTDNIAISGDITVKGYVSVSPDDFDNETPDSPDSAV